MIWQPVTYLFFHGGIWHVLINMFVLWMFGSELERLWGKEHFLKFYFTTGIGAGILTMLFGLNSIVPIVGASGAVYGVLLAYGITYPNRKIYLYGIIPIKSLWFVIGVGLIAFFSSFSNASQISHLTHLSGMIIGYLILKKPVRWNELVFKLRKKTIEYKMQKEHKVLSQQSNIEREIDSILDKINREGFDSLSEDEQERLYKGSQSLSKNRKKD
ncbi:MAG: rhomboid family intramembrane serine protease [Fidelibacterota bacterium]